jgi:peptidoglycan-N-acetylglucosamine deacetylase
VAIVGLGDWRLRHFGRPVWYDSAVSSGPIVSVTVDLDSIECYFRIHALSGGPPDEVRHVILRQCLPRLANLFSRHGIRATWFVVGQDLEEDGEGRGLLAELAKAGHELASHTHTHPYDLVRLPREQIAGEIDRAHAAITAVAGRPPVGFRAPGYEISADVIDRLCQRGYRYDSSTFPAIPYYLAKAAVMGMIRVAGRRSGSILGSPKVLGAPHEPYHPAVGAPYRRGDLPIVELPIAVTPWLRLPVIGTTLVMAPEWLRRRLVAGALSTRFFNLELHGIDLADAEADAFPAVLVGKQPDLRVPLARKLAALEATLEQARSAGASFLPLADAAEQM